VQVAWSHCQLLTLKTPTTRTPFFEPITPLSPSSRMSHDFDKADKLTFPPWQRQLRCRYRGRHIPWQTFTKRLDLSLCTNSVSVSFIFYFLLLVPPNCNTDTIV
jgi:hypothetical protein